MSTSSTTGTGAPAPEAGATRGGFSSGLGVLAATLGSAVGLGNIWKFPSLTGANGGAGFLLVYLLSTLLIGLPLMATWCESDMLFGAERTYCHLFFGLGDGGALAFFQFANKSDQDLFGPKMPETPFHHIALKVDADVQKAIEQLPLQYQVLVNGHYLKGMRYEDLAEALNLPMGTVKTHLHRAKRRLRHLLETEYR